MAKKTFTASELKEQGKNLAKLLAEGKIVFVGYRQTGKRGRPAKEYANA